MTLMETLVVQYENNGLIVWDGQQRRISRPVNADDEDNFKKWIDTYNYAVGQDKNTELLQNIGQDIYNWLDNGQGWLASSMENYNCPVLIEFQIPVKASPAEKAFLEVPWELLADQSGHLAKNPDLKFSPIRRIGKKSREERTPSKYRLNTVFMAASPRNVKPVLAYEREESVILSLNSEKSTNMDLWVEESGNLTLLTQMVNDVKPVDVVHISCHGNIGLSDEKGTPFLCMETITGEVHNVTADEFDGTYSQNRPRLLILSACKTAQTYENQELSGRTGYGSLAATIVKRGFEAVLGWSGSVGDYEATRFAGELYRNLSQSAAVEDAVAKARFSLFIPPDGEKGPPESRDWHLARLYLGIKGGGVLTQQGNGRFRRRADAGVKEFLGKKEKGLEVASRKEFVGRRREIQSILKECQEHSSAGVLIHGLGHQGKSSLAARVANRLHTHQLVLIYGKKGNERMYTACHVLNEFKTVADMAAVKKIDALLQDVQTDEAYLKAALKELLEGPFSGSDPEHPAVLMVIDDLEKLLIPPQGTTLYYRVQPSYQATLTGIISAFNEACTRSRLIITSRYDFELIDNLGEDIARKLMRLPLASMNDTEAEKQYLAKYGTQGKRKAQITLEPARVMAACKGNPGLQNLMFSLFNSEPESYVKALDEMEKYLEGGSLPEEQKVNDFLQDLAINNILGLLTDGEQGLLQAAAVFEIPVPGEVFTAIADRVGIAKNISFEKRLVGFGVLEQYEDLVYPERKSFMLNSIVGSRIEALPDEVIADLAGIITELLFSSWCSDPNIDRHWVCDHEIVKFALLASHLEAVACCAENCISEMDDAFLIKEAAEIAVECISLLENNQQNVPTGLYRKASDVCEIVGEVDKALEYIDKALGIVEEDLYQAASLYLRKGRILVNKGRVDEAGVLFGKAKEILMKEDKVRDMAIVTGDIARIKVTKGEVDEALKLHEEDLKVYDKLGNTREKAVTLGDIARIKVDKGEVDEALILHEERIQVFDKLGDTREKALTMGDIARIKVGKGEVDEALKLHEEMIQVFEKLGDTRSKALTLGDIARIKVEKGEVDEALKLHDEELKVYDKLGDMRSKAVTLGDIARIKVSKGEVDEALKLHEERIQVFDKLGDTREKALTLGDIARIKVDKGEVDEALKLYEESLYLCEKLGDIDGRANALWSIAIILLQKDKYQRAYEYLDESYQILLKIGRLDGISFVGRDLGILLCRAGQKDEGIPILKRSIEGFLKLGKRGLAKQLQEFIDDMEQ